MNSDWSSHWIFRSPVIGMMPISIAVLGFVAKKRKYFESGDQMIPGSQTEFLAFSRFGFARANPSPKCGKGLRLTLRFADVEEFCQQFTGEARQEPAFRNFRITPDGQFIKVRVLPV